MPATAGMNNNTANAATPSPTKRTRFRTDAMTDGTTTISSITGSSTSPNTRASDRAKQIVFSSLASLPSPIRQVGIQAFKNFLALRIRLQHLYNREENLANVAMIPKPLVFDFELTATVDVKNTQEFKELHRKTANDIEQMQANIKSYMVAAVHLEIKAMQERLQKLFCESVYTLATGFCKMKELDESPITSLALICTTISNEIKTLHGQVESNLRRKRHHPATQETLPYDVTFSQRSEASVFSGSSAATAPSQQDNETSIEVSSTILKFSGFDYSVKSYDNLVSFRTQLVAHNKCNIVLDSNCDSLQCRVTPTAINDFSSTLKTIFYLGWTTYLNQESKNYKDSKLETWAKEALTRKATEPVSTTVEDIDMNSPQLKELISKEVHKELQTQTNRIKQLQSRIKTLTATTPTKKGHPSSRPTHSTKSKKDRGAGDANKDFAKDKRKQQRDKKKKKKTGT
jgi:hypothetical protein